MKKKLILRFILFLTIPFVLPEIVFRTIPGTNEFYLSRVNMFHTFPRTEDLKKNIFIGSSHVVAAILPEKISQSDTSGGSITFNAGRGMSTSTVFYYALKKLAADGLLENSTVFLEAPGGISSYYDSMNDYWVDNRNVHLIIPYLDRHTFIQFWKFSANSFTIKCQVTAFYFFHSFRFYSLLKEVIERNNIIDIINKLNKKDSTTPGEADKNVDMVGKGGIKTDSVSVDKARKFAHAYFQAETQNQREIGIDQWKKSRLNEINQLLKENNGKLVLFRMPLSSVEDQVYKTDVSRKNIEIFQQFLTETDIPFIDYDYSDFEDSDFPDLWHLSKSKAEVFSDTLASSIY